MKHARRTRPLAATASQKLKLKFKTRDKQQQRQRRQQQRSRRRWRQRMLLAGFVVHAHARTPIHALSHTHAHSQAVRLACLNMFVGNIRRAAAAAFISQRRNERHLRAALSRSAPLSLSTLSLSCLFCFTLAALFGACSSKPNSSHRTLMAAGLLLSLPLPVSLSLLTSAQYFERNFLAWFYFLSRLLRFIVLLLLWLRTGIELRQHRRNSLEKAVFQNWQVVKSLLRPRSGGNMAK